MGVHGLKPLLPQKRIRDVWIAFPGSELRIDAANLLFRLALRQSRVFVNKNYYPAVAAFQRHMQYLRSRNVLFHMVFDGITRPEKCHEDNRRKERRKTAEENISRERESAANPDDVDVSRLVSNNSLYIALCVKVCSFLLIPFTVAPFEADSQLPKAGCVVVSSDSDMLVLGVERWVSIDNWITGEGHLIDITSFNVTHIKEFPLVAHVMQHGRILFEIVAAVFGCDFSENACGIRGIGKAHLLQALDWLDGPLTPSTIAGLLTQGDDSSDILEEVNRIIHIYRSSVCYNASGDIVLCSDESKVLKNATKDSEDHMRGLKNPKTGDDFDDAAVAALEVLSPAHLTHNSALHSSQVIGAKLSVNDPNKCNVVELRSFLTARGASSSGFTKEELVELVKNFLDMELEVPPQLVDRSDTSGIMLNQLESKHGTTPEATLDSLLKDHPDVINDDGLCRFLTQIRDGYTKCEVSDDINDIVQNGPEVTSSIVHLLYAPFGGGSEKKSFRESFEKMAAQNGIIYHANLNTNGAMIIISKQLASLTKDESTRTKGERPLPKEYLVFIELFVKATSDDVHGHSLGLVYDVGRSFCPCTAGMGGCVHKGMAVWAQIHHWGPDRPTDMPPTSVLCGWCQGSTKRSVDLKLGICGINFQKIEMDKPNKTFRRVCQSSSGGYYPVLQPSDEAIFQNEMTGEAGRKRLKRFCLSLAQGSGAIEESNSEIASEDDEEQEQDAGPEEDGN